MAIFTYKAVTGQGEVLEDQVEGNDRTDVATSLREQGLFVIEVKEVIDLKKEQSVGQRDILEPFKRIQLNDLVGQRDILEPFKRIQLNDLVVFTRQFATMIKAGIPIARVLYVLSQQTVKKKLKDVVDDIRTEVETGQALSEALEKHPKVFNRLYVEMVKAGEIGGMLDKVLLRIASQLETEQELRRKVKSAMTYPIFVLALAILAASFMFIFIVPIFADMFEDLGGDLPLPTRVAMGLSDILTSVFSIFIYAAMIGGVLLFLRWRKTENGRKVVDPAMLKLPVAIGSVIQKVALARFARTLATLSAAGVPILQALEITATSSGNYVVEKALLQSRDAVRQGLPIHAVLEEEPVFPPMVTRMTAVGEEAGDIDGMLTMVAEYYESEVDAAIKSLTSIFEPILIVVVGGIVGAVIIAMYLPMFRIFELIE